MTDITNDTTHQNDHFPEFAISLDEATTRIKMLGEFVRNHMVEGEDYGVIPGTNTKPTLFKPGAEKLNAMFGLAPLVEITNRVEDWDKGFVHYEIKVALSNKRTSNIEAEGIGSCNSNERRYKNQSAANIANTILKMAKKRALIDATLSATRASGVFTQDLEDAEQDNRNDSQVREPAPRRMQEAARATSTPPQNNQSNAPQNLIHQAQIEAVNTLANKVFGQNAKEELGKLLSCPLQNLTRSEASRLIDDLRVRQNEAPQQQPAPQVPPPTPQHIVRLKAAMKAKGAQYTSTLKDAWLNNINAHLNPTGDSPRIERILDLPADVADNLSQDIMEGKVPLPVIATPEPAQEVSV